MGESLPETGATTTLESGIDSVYLFMWPGWEKELRSNRWHYAKRWGRRRPVVLVQPERRYGGSRATSSSHIAGAESLSIVTSGGLEVGWSRGLVQTAQIARHMKARGHKRPLFWLYNPYLLCPYALLPAVFRVLHATENYFDFDPAPLPPQFFELHRRTIATSDLVVAVSSGVASGIRRAVPSAKVAVVTNGCDYLADAQYHPSAALLREKGAFSRIAIYAGNINDRLDYELLQQCVAAHANTLFAFVGPVSRQSPADAGRWRSLLVAKNVRHHGPVAARQLPDLYGASDVGLIPYKRVPLLERNGFPLKALEMAATELPVVSTFMEPLLQVGDAVHMVSTVEAFVARMAEVGRQTVSAEQQERMRATCRRYDYDLKFEEVVDLVSRHLSRTPTLHADALASDGGGELLEALTESVPGSSYTVRNVLQAAWHVSGNTLSSLLPVKLRRQIRRLLSDGTRP